MRIRTEAQIRDDAVRYGLKAHHAERYVEQCMDRRGPAYTNIWRLRCLNDNTKTYNIFFEFYRRHGGKNKRWTFRSQYLHCHDAHYVVHCRKAVQAVARGFLSRLCVRRRKQERAWVIYSLKEKTFVPIEVIKLITRYV